MKKDCCWKCPDRTLGCHAECSRYNEKGRQEVWAKKEKAIVTAESFFAFKADMVARTKKWIKERE